MIEVYNKVAQINPFPGLRSFDRDDAYLFFGRDHHLSELRAMLHTAPLLAIIGNSGSGKSSLIKAGLIPLLLRESDNWSVLPLTLSSDPFHCLAVALQNYLSEQKVDTSQLDIPTMLQQEPDALIKLITNQQPARSILLFIDQFEEIFQADPDESDIPAQSDRVSAFIQHLLAASQQKEHPVFIVLTMRSDFLDYCTLYEGLTEAINEGAYLLPRMNNAEIRDTITKPIATLGAQITPALTEKLLVDTDRNAHQLPVLQHALMRTWRHWQATANPGQPIDLTHYEAIGTMANALSIHAEELYASLPSDKTRQAAEKVFKSLITLGADDRSLITPVSIDTIKAITGLPEYLIFDVIDCFRAREACFLMPIAGTSVGQNTVINISRGRIVQLWERLRVWSQEETESAKLYKEIAKSAARYQQGKTGLLVPPELQLALKWQKENKPTPAWAERYDVFFERVITYLDYSKEQYDFEIQTREKRQKQNIRNTRNLAITGITIAVLAIIAAIRFTLLAGDFEQASVKAETNAKNAKKEQQNAEQQTKEAIAQSKIAKQLQEFSEQQRLLTEEQRQIAEVQRQYAQTQEVKAKFQQQIADRERAIAVEQKDKADLATKAARLAENRARAASKTSDSLKVLAERSSERDKQNAKEANRLSMLAIAQSIAIKALQSTEKSTNSPYNPQFLSVLAYQLNQKNGGPSNSPAIFTALAKAGDRKQILEGHHDNVRSIAIQSTGNAIASASDDGTVRLWHLASNLPTTVFTPPRRSLNGFRSVAFANNDKQLIAGSTDGRIYVWEVAQPKKSVSYSSDNSPVFDLIPYKKGTQLISVSNAGSVYIWQITPNGLDSLSHIETGHKLYAVTLSPDATSLICGGEEQLVTIDLRNLNQPPTLTNRLEFKGANVTALAISPDGKKLITGSSLGQVFLWNFGNNKIISQISLLPNSHTARVTSALFSPDGDLIITSSMDGSLRIWSRNDIRQTPIIISDYRNWVMAKALSADGNTLFYGGADQTIRTMTVDTKQLYNNALKAARGDLSDSEWNQKLATYLAQPSTLLDSN